MPLITFAPDIEIDSGRMPAVVPIKGRIPQLSYSFAMKDVYGSVPSLDVLAAYHRIREQFGRMDRLFASQLHLRSSRSLPEATQARDAVAVLRALFDPSIFYSDGIWGWRALRPPADEKLFSIESARPFPLCRASERKLLHTFAWIDANIKINVEQAAGRCALEPNIIRKVVEAALTIYSLIIKQQDFQMACSMNFNHSMFLQDRILNLIFGDALYLGREAVEARGVMSNRMALELLKGLSDMSLRQLSLSSIFMGTVWTSDESIQHRFLHKPEQALGDIDTQLQSLESRMAVDEIDIFFQELVARDGVRVVVVLDDNGESVFDTALFQRLLEEIPTLKVTFVVNRFPVSNNISEEIFLILLEDSYFAGLKSMLALGRASISTEQQVFRSFEMAYLSSETLRWIDSAGLIYIKGANFFETIQVPNKKVYHAFTIYGEMCSTLTGYPQGRGVFVGIPPGGVPFVYTDSDHVVTLKQIVETRWSQGQSNGS